MMRVFHILPSHSLCVLLGEEKDRWRHDIHINVFDLAEMAVYSWHTHTSLHDLSIEDDKGLQCPDLSLNFERCSVYTLEQMKLLSLTLNQLTVSPPSSSSWSHTHLLRIGGRNTHHHAAVVPIFSCLTNYTAEILHYLFHIIFQIWKHK